LAADKCSVEEEAGGAYPYPMPGPEVGRGEVLCFEGEVDRLSYEEKRALREVSRPNLGVGK
jgi:hypothetical protein